MGLIQNKVTVSQPNSHVVVKNAGGLRGLTGETGPQGPQGVPGEAATVTAGTTTTLPAGSDATVQNVGSTSAAIFNFGIPKGDKGDTGETGAAATISVGSTSTLPAGSSATVTNSGTSSAAVFDFGIPKGDKGDTGATGADGYSPTATVTKTGDTATITITDKDGTTTASISDGVSPTVNDGTLTIQKNGTTVQTFSADQASNVTANITVPTQFSELSGTVSSSQIEDEAITTGSVSGTGTNITLAGTMDGGAIESVELNGDTTQQTYSGKNLYNATLAQTTTNAVTVSADTSYMYVNGTSSVSGGTGFNFKAGSLKAGTYKFNIELVGGTITTTSTGGLFNFRGTNITIVSCTISSNSKRYSGTVSVSADTNDAYVQLWARGTETFTNAVVQYQLTSGSTADYDFEPYVGGTASPNPDYPQEVQTVTGEQTVTVVGKNLLDESQMEQGTFSYIDGYESAHTGVIRMDTYMPCQPNTTYTLSSDAVLGEIGVVYKDSNGTVVQGFSLGAETQTYTTFTTKSNATEMRIRIGKGAYPHTAGVDYKLQLELGNKPTSYAPYQGGSYPVNLGKNLFDKDNANTLTSCYVDNDLRIVNAGGSTTSICYIKCEPNTTYTVQKENTGTNNRFAVFTTATTPAAGVIALNLVGTNGAEDNHANYSITTPANAKYLGVFFAQPAGLSTPTSPEIMATIQIEKGSTATTYAPYFTPIELCKIGTYQDYIYKSGEDWYVHKEIKKFDLSTINYDGAGGGNFYNIGFGTVQGYNPNTPQLSNCFTYASTTWAGVGKFGIATGTGNLWMTITDSTVQSEDAPAWLKSRGAIMYGVLRTPTDTQITNATLISELEDLLSATTYAGNTYITVSGDLASPLEVVAEADSKLAPDSVYGAAIKDGAVSVDKIADLKALADALAPYLN